MLHLVVHMKNDAQIYWPLTSQTVYYSLLSWSHGPHGHFLAASSILHVKLFGYLCLSQYSAIQTASCELLSQDVETTWTLRRRYLVLESAFAPDLLLHQTEILLCLTHQD